MELVIGGKTSVVKITEKFKSSVQISKDYPSILPNTLVIFNGAEIKDYTVDDSDDEENYNFIITGSSTHLYYETSDITWTPSYVLTSDKFFLLANIKVNKEINTKVSSSYYWNEEIFSYSQRRKFPRDCSFTLNEEDVDPMYVYHFDDEGRKFTTITFPYTRVLLDCKLTIANMHYPNVVNKLVKSLTNVVITTVNTNNSFIITRETVQLPDSSLPEEYKSGKYKLYSEEINLSLISVQAIRAQIEVKVNCHKILSVSNKDGYTIFPTKLVWKGEIEGIFDNTLSIRYLN